MVYFLVAFSCFIVSLISISKENKNRDLRINTNAFLYFIFPVVLILLGGLRWQTGTDWPNYYNFYANHKSWKSFNNGEFEIVYTILNYLCKLINPSYTFFLLVFTGIIIVLSFITISKLTRVYFGITIFLWFCFLNGDILAIRQDLSIAIVLFSIPYIAKKEKKSFILITLLAVGVHNSAIIWFLSYYIYWKKINRMKSIRYLFICLFLSFFIAKLFVPIVLVVTNYLPSKLRIVGKLIVYINHDDGLITPLGVLMNLAKRFLVFPLLFYYEKKAKKECYWYSGVFSLYIFGTYIYLLFMSTPSLNVFQRFSAIFMPLEAFLLPQIFGVMGKKNYKWFIIFIYIYGFFKLYKSVFAFVDSKIPYYSIFNYVERF